MQYLFTFAFVALFDYAPELQRKTKERQGIRKESWKENKVTMRKYQWLQKHKQDTTALNTLPVRQTSPSNCDKTCVASPLFVLLTVGLPEEAHRWLLLSGTGEKLPVYQAYWKQQKHILLLGLLHVICEGVSSVHPFSRYMNDPCHSNTPLVIDVRFLVPILVSSTCAHSNHIFLLHFSIKKKADNQKRQKIHWIPSLLPPRSCPCWCT